MTVQCKTCGKEFKSVSGRAWHEKHNTCTARRNGRLKDSWGDDVMPKYSFKHKIWAEMIRPGVYHVTDNRKGDRLEYEVHASSELDAIETYVKDTRGP